MAHDVGSDPAGERAVDRLLPLAFSHPHKALAAARAVLDGQPDCHDASVAHQAAGIVLREFGNLDEGIRHFRAALRFARRTGSAARVTDVLASLGVALVYAGRTTEGLAACDQALRMSSGVAAGRILARRGMALLAPGLHAAALADLQDAVRILQRAGDTLWAARAFNARGVVHLTVGSPGRAEADFNAAERLFAQTGQLLESIYVVHNRAWASFSSGDIPKALARLDEAASRYRPLGLSIPALSADRCAVLLAAGLVNDALAEANAAVTEIERTHGQATRKAELLLMAANCALAAGQPHAAIDRAQAARRLFQSQRSTWWRAHAAVVLAQARHACGQSSARLLGEASRVASELEELGGASKATSAHLLAGQIALALGRDADADAHLSAAARSRGAGSALTRVSSWLGEALRAQAGGQPRRLLSACDRGLTVLDEHRFALGASELRAQATAHGAELAALAQRHAAHAGRPRLLLSWVERWRATALELPLARPQADAELDGGLAALRDVTRRLETAQRQGAPSAPDERELLRLEREQRGIEGMVRACALRADGVAQPRRAAIDVPGLLDQLDATHLIEIVDIDGVIHILVCGKGRVRQFIAGRAADATQAGNFARFALRRLARSRPGDDLTSAMAILHAAGPRLQDALLGEAARHLGHGPVVIVPPGKLHAIPWALLPALSDRVISVAPSASAWMRARAEPTPSRRHVMLARGPGLTSEGAEVPEVALLYDDVTVLAEREATADKVLSALDGAWLAHIAAHGTFRADSPLFSSLRMDDGPLTVYDFERLHRAPHLLVLSSCDSAVAAPTGSDELLGLVASLLPLGTAGIVASVVPLNDHAVVPVMVDLHRSLRAGRTLAESVRGVRDRLTDDPVEWATAVSLVALGAA
jgi:tetratricopeptide (TPR) repeat protein